MALDLASYPGYLDFQNAVRYYQRSSCIQLIPFHLLQPTVTDALGFCPSKPPERGVGWAETG